MADCIEDKEQTTLHQIEAAGSKGLFVLCDVAKPGDITAMIDKTFSAFGRLDFAFNNAGIEGISAPTQDCTLENWERTLAVNLTGIWLCMRHELPHMLRQGKGSHRQLRIRSGPGRIRRTARVRGQ
ncbi:SDR family oxidoreductase [Puia sp. P3]|uniref:SDR family oxidoreductase n=1 Tax=Puia sp. P3 TaxID=3423952 RepID=UPI003D67FCE6